MTKQKVPVEHDCFWFQKILLTFFGVSKYNGIFYKLYANILHILISIYPILEIIEVPNILDDFNELVYSMLFIIGYLTCLFIIYNIVLHRVRINRIFVQVKDLKIMSNSLMENKNQLLEEAEVSIEKQSFIGTGLTVFALLTLISLAMVMSRNRDRWIYPFGNAPNFNNTNLELLAQSVFYFIIGFTYLSIVVIQLNLLLLVSSHCKILQDCIENILEISYKTSVETGKLTLESRNSVPWSFIKPELTRVVEYHVGIIEMGANIEQSFNFVSLAIFIGMSSVLCISIYHMLSLPEMNENILQDIVLIFITYFSMTIPSIRGQQVITESEKIMEVCCQIDYIGTDVRFQKALMMIIVTSQRPIVQTVGKCKILCLSTMVGVFQTTYTFFTFLRNVKE